MSMNPLPEVILQAWEKREPICILATVDQNGHPNVIYVGVVGRFDESTFFVANNAFQKTKQNILNGSKAALLFMTKERKAYQLKGSIVLEDKGPVFDAMKAMNPPQYPGHSAAVLRVEEAYSGAERLA